MNNMSVVPSFYKLPNVSAKKKVDNNANVSFSGKTKIYALTDSHQHTRDKCALLSQIIKESKSNKNILILDNGDMFKGVYPRELEVESYIKLKKMAPSVEVVINVGNNDPGYGKADQEFFEHSVKKLTENGIHVVSANTWKQGYGHKVNAIKPYVTVTRDNDKLLVAGFAINTFSTTVPGMLSKDSSKALSELKGDINKEKPDGLIILNHDYLDKSKELLKTADNLGLNVDLVVGGHCHKPYYDDEKIYYPEPFSKGMLELGLNIDKKAHKLTNENIIASKGLKINRKLEDALIHVERRDGLNKGIINSVIGLEAPIDQAISTPSNLGTFLADGMCDIAQSEIGFVSNGFISASLPYKPGQMLTLSELNAVVPPGPARLDKVEMTPKVLKEVFENALENQHDGDYNKKYIQYSGNIKVERRIGLDKENDAAIRNKVIQIYINDEPLFDFKTGKPLEPNRKITCAVDSYLGSGKQGFKMLKNLPKEEVLKNGRKVGIDKTLRMSLGKLAKNAPDIEEYYEAEMKNHWTQNNQEEKFVSFFSPDEQYSN